MADHFVSSVPRTSYIKARLVSLWCFVLTMLLQITLASPSICSFLFHCGYELLSFWMVREGTEIFHHSPLRELMNKCIRLDREKKFMIAAETQVLSLHFRRDLIKIVYVKSLWVSDGVPMCNSRKYPYLPYGYGVVSPSKIQLKLHNMIVWLFNAMHPLHEAMVWPHYSILRLN